MLLKKVIK